MDPCGSGEVAVAPSKSWLASFPKFSRTLDTLWSIDFQKNCAVNGKFSLPARRYASAGISHGPVSVCLCVCLSQVGVLVKWLDGSSWFLAWRLVLTCPTLYFKEIRVSTKIRVLELFPKLRSSTCQLSWRKVSAQSVINWTVVCQLS